MTDYEAPIWEQITECRRMLDIALRECKERGGRMVKAKAAYYSVKSERAFELYGRGLPVTLIQETIRGDAEVNKAMREFNAAEVEYENAKEARQVWKKHLDTLREQYSREWAAAKEE